MPCGKDQQGIKQHIQSAHQHQQYAGGTHIAAGLQESCGQTVQLYERQGKGENKKVGRGVGAESRIRPQQMGQRRGDSPADGGQQETEAQGGQQSLLRQITGIPLVSCADALGHHHGKAHHQRMTQTVEKPGAGGNQTNGSGSLLAETAHHGGVNILHGNGRELGQNGRNTQLQRQQDLLRQR